MPSNKEVWTLPLPPNLAPLQCARALPAASAVARAAACLAAAPIRLSRGGAAPGAQRGRDGGRAGSPGWGGAAGPAAAPFPTQTPLLGRVAPAHAGSGCYCFQGYGSRSRSAVALLGRLRGSGARTSSASTQGHLDGGRWGIPALGFQLRPDPDLPRS